MDVEKFLERLNELYLPPKDKFTVIDIPLIRYAGLEGRGNPAGANFESSKKWLYSVVHVLKPIVKKMLKKRYAEPPLEYQFWADYELDFIYGNKDNWNWRVMVAMVDWISEDQFQSAAAVVEEKLGPPPGTLKLIELDEGVSVQIMLVGDYSKVQEVCDELYSKYLPKRGFKPNGAYHEIYLNDPTRTAPEKRRIVIRQPVR